MTGFHTAVGPCKTKTSTAAPTTAAAANNNKNSSPTKQQPAHLPHRLVQHPVANEALSGHPAGLGVGVGCRDRRRAPRVHLQGQGPGVRAQLPNPGQGLYQTTGCRAGGSGGRGCRRNAGKDTCAPGHRAGNGKGGVCYHSTCVHVMRVQQQPMLFAYQQSCVAYTNTML